MDGTVINAQRKRRRIEEDDSEEIDIIIFTQVLSKMAASLDEYIRSKTSALNVEEIYEVVSAIPDLTDDVVFKACNWLMEDEKKFLFLKILPSEKRKGYILTSMP